MNVFEEICLNTRENVKLLVVYFAAESTGHEHKQILKTYQAKHPEAELLWIEANGTFSRGLALTLGANQFDGKSLLFFCDVDLVFDAGFLHRCRKNTILGQQVYYPMVFSQFNPDTIYETDKKPNSHFIFDKDAGFWRIYAFGIVSVYNNDLRTVGGFDTTIQGWGLEDVDLYGKFVNSEDLTVFRAPDPGLVHVYHDVICDPKLAERQHLMCQRSKASVFGSAKSLARILVKKGYLGE